MKTVAKSALQCLRLKFNTGHELVFTGDNRMLKISLKNLYKQGKRLVEAYDLYSETPKKPVALTLLAREKFRRIYD